MDASLLSLLMFVMLFLALGLGLHISFGLYAIALGFAYFLWGAAGMNTVVMAIWGMMNNFPLIAIPLFIFMAMVLEKSDLVGDIYDCFYKWSGALRGGLAIATVLVGAMIGAVSGVVAAGVIGLGIIALPQMAKFKYNQGVNLGSILSGGTLGQIIPPSLVMIVYSAVTGQSVGKLFAAGVSVGLLLVVLFSLYILIRSYIQKDFCPPLPLEERVGWYEKIVSLRVLILPGILIVATVGSILTGLATPTEGAGVGAFGALLFSIVTGRFRLSILTESLFQTLKVSSMIGWMIGGAAAFSAVFAAIGGNRVIVNIAMNMPGGEWGVLLLAIAFIFFLGMFLETMAIIMLAAPILSPIIVTMGFDPLWWAIVFMTLLQSAYITPPFGVALFYLKGVTPPHIKLTDIYRASVPFICLQLLAVALLIFFPPLGLWLPSML
ncbi:TRAP transporter large permease subunit [Pararhodobacter sp. SW119]|uniref:TRAP transporter large permease n=1 Tax=Pararhodobacter sp. SW119 TaxID=2780075 RepID=UPI001ADF9766|nr:TRAP transporter large permease subunit [Pararhodobacter sp. SW119]